jgi:hypothetical protein
LRRDDRVPAQRRHRAHVRSGSALTAYLREAGEDAAISPACGVVRMRGRSKRPHVEDDVHRERVEETRRARLFA